MKKSLWFASDMSAPALPPTLKRTAPVASPSTCRGLKGSAHISFKEKKDQTPSASDFNLFMGLIFFFSFRDHFLSFLPEVLACSPPKLLIKEVKR